MLATLWVVALTNSMIAGEIEELFKQANAAQLRGDYDVAISGWDWDKAVSDYSACIRLNPTNASNYVYRGKAHSEKKQFDDAISDFSEAIRLNPEYWPYFNRGWAYYQKGAFGKATNDFQQALQMRPDGAPAYAKLAWILATCPEASIRNGKVAVAFGQKASELTGWKDWHCIAALAAAHAEAGDFEQAVKYQKQVMDIEGLKDDDRAEQKPILELYQKRKPFHEVRSPKSEPTAKRSDRPGR